MITYRFLLASGTSGSCSIEFVNSDANKVINVFSHWLRGKKMRAYQEAYLSDAVENQGKLFDLVSQNSPQKAR